MSVSKAVYIYPFILDFNNRLIILQNYCTFVVSILNALYVFFPNRSLCSDNLLLRGSRLRNTDFVFGIAVYTGIDTKVRNISTAFHLSFCSNYFTLIWFIK